MNLEGKLTTQSLHFFYLWHWTQPGSTLFSVLCSAQNQEAESLKRCPAEQPTRGHSLSTSGGSLSLTQVHASTRAHDAVAVEGHRARHLLRRLRQHPAWHLHSPHDYPQQAGRPTGHLCCEVGQGSARSVGAGYIQWDEGSLRWLHGEIHDTLRSICSQNTDVPYSHLSFSGVAFHLTVKKSKKKHSLVVLLVLHWNCISDIAFIHFNSPQHSWKHEYL